jgi:hypothetical protein
LFPDGAKAIRDLERAYARLFAQDFGGKVIGASTGWTSIRGTLRLIFL